MDPKRRPTGSVSLGSTSGGRLLRAVALPPVGRHHGILPGYRARHTNYGTEELVELITFAARRVATHHPGAQLRVGNMSLRSGGDLPWSVSHNAGRDADLAFFLRRRGRPVPAPSLVHVGGNLRSRKPRGFRFDVARNWTLVAALLSHPRIVVQWLFISNPLREALLAHGRRVGASAKILARADKVLRQPSDGRPHADHLHLRLYCSRNDRLEGCQDRGPVWPGVDDHHRAVAARIRMLLPGLQDPDARIRGRVIDALERLDARREALHLARALRAEADPRNQRALLGLLRRWEATGPAVLGAMTRLLERPDLGPGAPVREVYALLGRYAKGQVAPILRRGLASNRLLPRAGRAPAVPEAVLAAKAARRGLDRRLVPALLVALDSPRSSVRHAAAEALRRITNHSFGLRWTGALPPTRRHRQVARWQVWWQKHRALSREALVVRGFKRLRRRWDGLSHPRTLRWLVALTRGSDHLAFNADRFLARFAGAAAAKGRGGAPIARHAAWQRWYHKRFPPRRRRPRASARRRLPRQGPRRSGTLAVARRRRSPTARPAPRRRRRPRPKAVRAPR